MFTGIIETTGVVKNIEKEGTNIHIWVETPITSELKIDQSVAHNGVCLTVVDFEGDNYKVTAIKETLDKSTFRDLQIDDILNIERCMPANGRFDGHIVQGHIDGIAVLHSIQDEEGSKLLTFEYQHPEFYTVDKGSVTINGTSLTVVNNKPNQFSVALIPYTWEHTNFKHLTEGDFVNIEFDILGKYVQQHLQKQNL